MWNHIKTLNNKARLLINNISIITFFTIYYCLYNKGFKYNNEMKIMFNILFIINIKKNIVYYLFKSIDFHILFIYISLYTIFFQ